MCECVEHAFQNLTEKRSDTHEPDFCSSWKVGISVGPRECGELTGLRLLWAFPGALVIALSTPGNVPKGLCDQRRLLGFGVKSFREGSLPHAPGRLVLGWTGNSPSARTASSVTSLVRTEALGL